MLVYPFESCGRNSTTEFECMLAPRPAQRVTVGELPRRVPIVQGKTVIQSIGLAEAVVPTAGGLDLHRVDARPHSA